MSAKRSEKPELSLEGSNCIPCSSSEIIRVQIENIWLADSNDYLLFKKNWNLLAQNYTLSLSIVEANASKPQLFLDIRTAEYQKSLSSIVCTVDEIRSSETPLLRLQRRQ